MSKPYSNKALPAGTVLREWRLEDILGVGGFGIVYKGRGIYFDELVAIKEYFPSAISQRDEDDTVVPVDSDAEEVHALGLKKFVEEAKLLWNLSTPTRHPNIVNVRSLFEIHGTAYMVMDFEDGLSLSKMLKQGTKFNERSLWNIVQPIAEGLDRAHRVGVLHRDIKPPNILINDDGRPVLIDFGSARFEAAEATSTTVTFHTPPYAALEQYVKTYPQGPWTDIYALGVVLYECVTGKKPAEVLERMHGGADEPLSGGKWPGYTKKFLAAIDAAMTIKPQERPQSIKEWLDMFGKPSKAPKRAPADADDNEDATRVFTHELANADIVPVAPPAGDFNEDEPVKTEVPAHPSAAEFKGAGQETGARRKMTEAPAKPVSKEAPAAEAETPKTPDEQERKKPVAAVPLDRKADALGEKKKSMSPMLIGGAAVALVVAAGGAWMLFGGKGAPEDALAESQPIPSSTSGKVSLSMLAAATKALADDATKAGAPLDAATRLAEASDQLTQQYEAYQRLANDPAQSAALDQREAEMRQLATKATADFTQALFRDTDAKAQRLAAAVPWANPARESSGLPQDRQQIAGEIRTSLGQLRSAAEAAAKATTPAQAIDYARLALAQTQNFTTASLAAYNIKSDTAVATVEAPREVEDSKAAAPRQAAPTRTAAPQQQTRRAPVEAASSATTLSPSKISEINAIVADGRNMAKDVIRMGRRGRDPQLKANADLAKNYDQNLATLKDSARGISSDREADRLIAQAKQTRAYLQFLVKQSNGLK